MMNGVNPTLLQATIEEYPLVNVGMLLEPGIRTLWRLLTCKGIREIRFCQRMEHIRAGSGKFAAFVVAIASRSRTPRFEWDIEWTSGVASANERAPTKLPRLFARQLAAAVH